MFFVCLFVFLGNNPMPSAVIVSPQNFGLHDTPEYMQVMAHVNKKKMLIHCSYLYFKLHL